QVAHQWDIGVAVGAGPAEDDAIVHADEVAADAVDPEEEAALGTGRLDPRHRPRRRRGTRRRDRAGGAPRWDFGGAGPGHRGSEAGNPGCIAAEPDDALGRRGRRPGSVAVA